MSGISMAEFEDSVVQVYNEFGVTKKMTVEEMMAAPGPSQVSNRTIYDRCLEWGCKVTRSNGNWVWMMSPVQYRFKIRPVQQHVANGRPDLEKMLAALAIPWAVFIAAEILDAGELVKLGESFKKYGGPGEEPDDEMGPCSVCEEGVIRAVMVKRGKKIAHSYCVKPVEAQPDESEENKIVPSTEIIVVEAPLEEQKPAEEVVTSRLRYINDVFDLLVERGDPMSNRAVAQVLGLTPSQATSALGALAAQGVLKRIKSGVYQAMPDVRSKQGTVGLVLSGGLIERQGERQQQVRTVTAAQVAEPFDEPDATEDETLNELLDLMAPHGFKARHLPLIDAFKSCALALMREVNGA